MNWKCLMAMGAVALFCAGCNPNTNQPLNEPNTNNPSKNMNNPPASNAPSTNASASGDIQIGHQNAQKAQKL